MLQGPAGAIEAQLDVPEPDLFAAPHGTVVVAHPHPQFGGTMTNKVVQTIARAYVQCGWRAVRFNFRGVGASAGVYDHGQGELSDLLAVVAQQAALDAPLALAGFSFGAFVTAHAVEALHVQRPLSSVVLVGTAASRFTVAPVPACQALLIWRPMVPVLSAWKERSTNRKPSHSAAAATAMMSTRGMAVVVAAPKASVVSTHVMPIAETAR